MTVLNDYIAKRYPRWMDYAIYQAAQAGIPDEATDLLNEVMIMLLNKSRDEMERLISMKKNGYTELDFFVLRIIKLNAHSSTSPYRSKNKPLPVDGNADYTRLDVIDDPDPDVDRSGLTLWRMQMVRFIFDNLDLSDFDRSVFEYRFFQGEPFNAWPNTDTLKELVLYGIRLTPFCSITFYYLCKKKYIVSTMKLLSWKYYVIITPSVRL